MTIASDFLRMRIETDKKLAEARPEMKARLLANWLISPSASLLTVPDFAPPAVEIIRGLFGDCSHPAPLADAAPVACDYCWKQVGTIEGLAVSAKAMHKNCSFQFSEPPWFQTEGFSMISFAAFPKNKEHVRLLKHYIITEHLENERRKQERYAAQGSADGFEFIGSLS